MAVYDRVKRVFQDLIAPEFHEIRGETRAIRCEIQGLHAEIQRLDGKIDGVDARLTVTSTAFAARRCR